MEPWPYNPKYTRLHIKNTNKDHGFLNQVPTLLGVLLVGS